MVTGDARLPAVDGVDRERLVAVPGRPVLLEQGRTNWASSGVASVPSLHVVAAARDEGLR